MSVLFDPLNWFTHNNQIVKLRKRSVLRSGSAHVNNPLLKTYNLAGRDHAAAAQHIGSAAPHSGYFGNDTRE